MMSLSNMMEIITKDSVDFSEASSSALGVQSRSSTSHSVRTDSQLSLECLPPEVPRYTSSGLPASPPRCIPSSSCSDDYNGGPISPRKSNENHSPNHPHHSWSAENSKNTCKEEHSSSQMLYDRIQQLSDKIHTELRPFQDDTHKENESTSGRLDKDYAAETSNQTEGHSSRQSPYVIEDISSGNSTLADEESLSDVAVHTREIDSGDRDSTSHALVAYSETNKSPAVYNSIGEQGQLYEDLDCSGGALGGSGDGDIGYSHEQESSGKISGEGQKLHASTSDIDPKLYKALEKMRKLDERLASISKKEREVKRQRKLLEQQLEGMDSSSEARFEGQSSTALVAVNDYEETVPTSPIFVTHLDDNSSSVGERSERTENISTVEGDRKTEEMKEGTMKEKQSNKMGQGQQQDDIHGTNFIKRNIELASDAGALVSMTESEKKRLEELMCDDNELEDPYSGPKVVGAIEGEGFALSKEDLHKMRDIDSRLQLMIPPSDWESICSSTSRNTTPAATFPQHSLSHSHHTVDTHSLDGDDDRSLSLEPYISSNLDEAKHIAVPGEEVLHHFQISREESKRLKDIEGRLLAIREEKERMLQEAVVPLAVTDLKILLEQCTRELQCSPACDSHTDGTDSQHIYSDNHCK